MTFDLGWHWKVKSRSLGVHWAVYHTQCIVRQRSCQAERPLVQHIPGKSFRLKFLMYVSNTFRGHIKLQKDFRWTVWRSNTLFGTHLEDTDPSMPLFYITASYICILFNMCNILFVIEWNFKAFFLIVQLPWINTIKFLIDV